MKLIGESPSGKAEAFGASIRRFDPCLPSQLYESRKKDRSTMRSFGDQVLSFVVVYFFFVPYGR